MKVSGANQTLILASDGPTGGKSSASASQSSRSSSTGGSSAAALQRVTVGVELPDSTVVYVHADYGTRSNAASPADRAASNADRIVSSQTPSAVADSDSVATPVSTDVVAAGGSNTTASTSASASSLVQLSSPAYNSLLRDSDNSRDTAGNPHSNNESVALYARTQRLGGSTRSSSLVDVHA